MKLHGIVTPVYPYTLSWTPGVSLDEPDKAFPLFTANVIGANTLKFIARSSAGCSDSDEVTLTVFPAKFLNISPDTAICPGDSIQIHLTAVGAKSFKWIPDINISNTKGLDPMVWPIASQTYTVFGVDTNSCYDTQRVKITVKPAAFMHLPDSVKLYPGETYKIEPGGNCLYFSWFPNVGLSKTNIANPIASPQVNTRYIVNASTEFGCTITDSLDVIVVPDSYIDMPNAFSPGAGPNRYLKPLHLGTATLKRFEVYNRWGKKMFETKDINEGWDGMVSGQPQPMGVYVYYLEATTPTGRTVIKQGNVTLLR
jgi:gliding motility-associated-like protein